MSSNLHSLEQPLDDSRVLLSLANEAGITMTQARTFMALLSNIPLRQAVRISATAWRDRVRMVNRETRKSR